MTELVQGVSFTWETTSPGVITTGGHFVELSGEGSVVTLTLRQRGFLAGIIGAVTGTLAQKYLAMELAGFKTGAENSAVKRAERV